MTPDQYPSSLEKALTLWDERAAKFPHLHGFGISGTTEAPIYAFFVELLAPPEEVNALLEAAAEFTDRDRTQILRFDRFREIPSPGIGKVPTKTSGPLQAGGDVFATNPKCGDGLVGTIGAFLQTSSGSNTRWLLSNYHILARGKGCEKPVKVYANAPQPVSEIVIPIELLDEPNGNVSDAALAEMHGGLAADPAHPVLSITTAVTVRPATGAILFKLGRGARVAQGKVIYWCPRVEASSDTTTRIFTDQMFVGTPAQADPFILDGDSGSIAVVKNSMEVNPAGLLFVAFDSPPCGNCDLQGTVPPFALVSPLDSVIKSFSGLIGTQLQLIVPSLTQAAHLELQRLGKKPDTAEPLLS
jgi:hypothetical protein